MPILGFRTPLLTEVCRSTVYFVFDMHSILRQNLVGVAMRATALAVGRPRERTSAGTTTFIWPMSCRNAGLFVRDSARRMLRS